MSSVNNLRDIKFFEETGLGQDKNLVGPVTLMKTLNYIYHKVTTSGDLVVVLEYIRNKFNKDTFDLKISSLYKYPIDSEELVLDKIEPVRDVKFTGTIYACTKKLQAFKSLDGHNFAAFRVNPKSFKYSAELTERIEISKYQSQINYSKYWYSAWIKLPIKHEVETISDDIAWEI